MTVNQVIQALGSWTLRLREGTPREILDALEYFGHVAIGPGRLDPAQYGDNLLSTSRYVGVFLARAARNEFELSGQGMAWWLGDSDDKGYVFETAVNLNAVDFEDALTALRPPAVVLGTVHPVTGTYTGTHRWETPRKAITYVSDVMDAEWRVNGDATLDAGYVSDLYRTVPQVLLMSKVAGRELSRRAVTGALALDTDAEDYSTRVVVLAAGEGESVATGSADVPSVPYRDMHGNELIITRLVSSAETTAGNANAVAQLQLNRFVNPRQNAKLSSQDYFVAGDLVVGDYISVFDPTNGYVDTNNEAYWQGQPINPVNLRCVEMSWPVEAGWTVAFRNNAGEWTDLSDYYIPESGQTNITVGEFSRALTGVSTQPVGTRPIGDSSIPDTPAFTGFSTGTYQTGVGLNGGDTKAAIRAQWTTPSNLDGTTILDGHHYEIRYRPNAVIGYMTDWDTVGLYSWDDLATWDALLTDPIVDEPQWLTAYVGWDTNAFTIQELTPAVQYELQIRAVDSAAPPNNSPWSDSEFVLTTGDAVPPVMPAPPVVAASRIAIQVVHELGAASGGTFNLDPDLDHLDVHVGSSAAFLPDESNKLGQLIANNGMMQGSVPAIGTFSIERVDQIHVKVVAVDRAGNKSPASEDATVTVDLIDDAHISDLTVTKIMAGTISAQWILGNKIVTGETGARSEMGPEGLEVFDNNGVKQIKIGAIVPGSTDPYDYGLAAIDPDTGDLVSLNALAFGMEGDEGSGGSIDFGDTGGSYDADPGGNGPKLQHVRIGDSLRAAVTVTSTIGYFYPIITPDPGRIGAVSFRITRESDGFETWPGSDSNALLWESDGTLSAHSASLTYFCRGAAYFPTPGLYTIELMYRVFCFNAGRMFFQNRQIIVQPF